MYDYCETIMFGNYTRRSCRKRVVLIIVSLMIVYTVVSRIMNNAVTERRALFVNKPLVAWAINTHHSPPRDAAFILQQLGIKVHQFVKSGTCKELGVCEQTTALKVIGSADSFYLPRALIPQFYEAYKDDPVMKSVDVFLCFDPAAICQLYKPFNKSLVVIASNRYYVGRESDEAWRNWNDDLKQFAADRKHFVGANNKYDAEFIRYYTGIDAKVIPSYCAYVNATYRPTSSQYLLAKRRNPEVVEWFMNEFYNTSGCNKTSSFLVNIDQRYPHGHNYSDLAGHMGIVHLPYQVSTMSIFEQYRMSIPLFFPTQRLLLEWNEKYWVWRERTWMALPSRDSHSLPPHPSQTHVPNPNNNRNVTAVKYWMQFADFYIWPHITYYDSMFELVEMLRTLRLSDLMAISKKMNAYNAEVREEVFDKWTEVLLNVAKYSSNYPH